MNPSSNFPCDAQRQRAEPVPASARSKHLRLCELNVRVNVRDRRNASANWSRRMTNDDKYYRQQALEAEKQAHLARNEVDREAWLRIARDWMTLARNWP